MVVRVLLGLTSPSVVTTLPVYGLSPLIQCLIVQSQSREVQNFLGQALSIVDAQTSQASKVHVLLSARPTTRAGEREGGAGREWEGWWDRLIDMYREGEGEIWQEVARETGWDGEPEPILN